ncbi:phosphatidylserine decarboxylase [uncultured Clostridium sp.]|uniref:phosphatidylserine decarboxylase n=1 Tax=uncultured Clostridium sp. TaxID=59620 RepID=UPI002606F661|nr:phosphatidylserine decarboxylase [uncultured Clostridium sp.]
MLLVYNRRTKQYEKENIAGKKYLVWCYESPKGKKLTELIFKKKLCSKVYGAFCDTKFSRKKIKHFIRDFDIDMAVCKKKPKEFSNFNDFFTRKLKPDARPFDINNKALISPADGRVFAYENIDLENLVQIKGLTYSLKDFINNDSIANQFQGGTCVIVRLSPIDYHRFHFIDSGVCTKSTFIPGKYYSVNPIALKNIPRLFCENKREWSLFKSDNFNDVLYVEVGATCVGTIIQTYNTDTTISKGDEKGFFKFGGSTVVLFFKKGSVVIDNDILEQTELGYESKVSMGESIGKKYE